MKDDRWVGRSGESTVAEKADCSAVGRAVSMAVERVFDWVDKTVAGRVYQMAASRGSLARFVISRTLGWNLPSFGELGIQLVHFADN